MQTNYGISSCFLLRTAYSTNIDKVGPRKWFNFIYILRCIPVYLYTLRLQLLDPHSLSHWRFRSVIRVEPTEACHALTDDIGFEGEQCISSPSHARGCVHCTICCSVDMDLVICICQIRRAINLAREVSLYAAGTVSICSSICASLCRHSSAFQKLEIIGLERFFTKSRKKHQATW